MDGRFGLNRHAAVPAGRDLAPFRGSDSQNGSGLRSTESGARRPPPAARFAPRHPASSRLERTVRREIWLAFLTMGGEAFPDVRARESEKLQRQRGVEDPPGGAQPIVERVFR